MPSLPRPDPAARHALEVERRAQERRRYAVLGEQLVRLTLGVEVRHLVAAVVQARHRSSSPKCCPGVLQGRPDHVRDAGVPWRPGRRSRPAAVPSRRGSAPPLPPGSARPSSSSRRMRRARPRTRHARWPRRRGRPRPPPHRPRRAPAPWPSCGSRVNARTANSRSGSSRIARTSPPPCEPVAPTTAISFFSVIALSFRFGLMCQPRGNVSPRLMCQPGCGRISMSWRRTVARRRRAEGMAELSADAQRWRRTWSGIYSVSSACPTPTSRSWSTCPSRETGRMRAFELGEATQWEKSRMSHHLGPDGEARADPQEESRRPLPGDRLDRRGSGRDQGLRARTCRPGSRVLRRRPRPGPASNRYARHPTTSSRPSRNTRRSTVTSMASATSCTTSTGSVSFDAAIASPLPPQHRQRPGGMADGVSGQATCEKRVEAQVGKLVDDGVDAGTPDPAR